MNENEKKLFNKVVRELQSFTFNTTNLVDDLSKSENEREKERVENAITVLLRTLTV